MNTTLLRAIGSVVPLTLAPYSFYLARRDITYDQTRLPPRRTFAFATLSMQWITFMLTWLASLMTAYALFFLCTLAVLNREPELYSAVTDAALFPFHPDNVLWHVAIVTLPMFLAGSVAWTRMPDTRAKVEESLRFLLTTMFAVFVATYAACAWSAVAA